MIRWFTTRVRAFTANLETKNKAREAQRKAEEQNRRETLMGHVTFWRTDLRKNLGVTFVNECYNTDDSGKHAEAELFFKTMGGDIHRMVVTQKGAMSIKRV